MSVQCLTTCETCGALIDNMETHNKYHQEQEEILAANLQIIRNLKEAVRNLTESVSRLLQLYKRN